MDVRRRRVWLWEHIDKDFGINEIVTGYGMTECGGPMTPTLPEDPPRNRLVATALSARHRLDPNRACVGHPPGGQVAPPTTGQLA